MKKDAKSKSSPLGLTRRAAAALKRAGESAAYEYCCGTGRGSNGQTVKSFAWREGYRIRIYEKKVTVSYQMEYHWHTEPQEKIRRKNAEFAAILEAAGLICFVTEAGPISVAGVKDKTPGKPAGSNPDELPLWRGRLETTARSR